MSRLHQNIKHVPAAAQLPRADRNDMFRLRNMHESHSVLGSVERGPGLVQTQAGGILFHFLLAHNCVFAPLSDFMIELILSVVFHAVF